jgi:hypothetical protein
VTKDGTKKSFLRKNKNKKQKKENGPTREFVGINRDKL